MKKLTGSMFGKLGLVVVLLTAGFCYSRGMREEAIPLAAESELAAEETERNAAEDAEIGVVESTSAVCFVHVCGQVNHPGVYELAEGQRVFDAIESAGGFTETAATDYLNLAEPVRDGMKLVVPDQKDVPKQVFSDGTAGEGASEEKLLDLNTATKEELMTLPGIGEAKAADLIRYRETHGRFQKIEDVMKISGIKEAAFEKIKERVTVSP